MVTINGKTICEKLYKTEDGVIVLHNTTGEMYDYNEVCSFALENLDEIEFLPGPTQEQLLAECITKRKKAYTEESDPIYMEAVRNSLVDGGPPVVQDWLDKVQEIKDRYPKP